MIRQIVFIFLLMVGFTAIAQDYTNVDNKVKNYPDFSSIDDLAIRIRNDYTDDAERLRAAFIWLTENITYSLTLNELFETKPILLYYSEYGKNHQTSKYHLNLIRQAFENKTGVCLDYSLMLAYLCKSFGIKSKIIYGLTKTDIKNFDGKPVIKKHTWNAVFIEEKWELMDPTWATGYFDLNTGKFIKEYMDHFFFTQPSDLIKTHFPSDNDWQLIKDPMDLSAFFSAPIFFPAYFEGQVKLSPETKGILVLSEENESLLIFDRPLKRAKIYYLIHGERQLRKMKFKKENNTYISKIKFRKKLKYNKYITVFNEDKAIINFKIKSDDDSGTE